MSNNVTFTINGIEIIAKSDKTILKAAEDNNIYIPRLCFRDDVHKGGNCKLCWIRINGAKSLRPSCRMLVEEGMEVVTNDKAIHEHVTKELQKLSDTHIFNCFSCAREYNCEFLDLVRRFSIKDIDKYGEQKKPVYYKESGAMILDSSKCTFCRRCISACKRFTGLNILGKKKHDGKAYVGPIMTDELLESGCISCGQCLISCPTGALSPNGESAMFQEALRDPNKTVIVQIAPAVRAALGEEFGYPIGTNVEGQLFAALKAIGVDHIADTNFGADLTIVEEAHEFATRLENKGPFPMFTSCSPGWVNYLEIYEPDYIPNLSSCKSCMQMAGAMVKTYYAKKLDLDPHSIFSVGIMPCIAKREEGHREGMGRDGYKDIDAVVTTTEFANFIKHQHVDFRNLEPIPSFGDLSVYTGAGAIFGATGGVMEAALRTAADLMGGDSSKMEYLEMRGMKDIKEGTYMLDGKEINVAVVHGGIAIQEFFKMLKETDKVYHFVEIMGCTGGCINGGGQPVIAPIQYEALDVRKLRASVLYGIDKNAQIRKSHLNPSVIKVYDELLETPGSKIAHDLLHTTYKSRKECNHLKK